MMPVNVLPYQTSHLAQFTNRAHQRLAHALSLVFQQQAREMLTRVEPVNSVETGLLFSAEKGRINGVGIGGLPQPRNTVSLLRSVTMSKSILSETGGRKSERNGDTVEAPVHKAGNLIRAKAKIKGTRPLLQHAFGPEALPLEKQERTGVAGNDPTEWKRTCLVTPEGQLYVRGSYVFSCIRDAAKHTRKGKGSLMGAVAATLQVEETVIPLLNRHLPEAGNPPADPTQEVYIDVTGVRNPSTRARNVRYRLAAAAGWKLSFTILWDKTVVSREQMRAILRDAGTLVGIGDGRSMGNGRFVVLSFEEIG